MCRDLGHVLLLLTQNWNFNLQESIPGATGTPVETKLESVTSPTQLETTISNTTNSRSADDDDPAHVPVTTPEMVVPLQVDSSVQRKMPSKETEDIKYPETTEMPEEVTHNNELKPEQIGTSSVKLGLDCGNTNVVDMKTEFGIQEILTDQVEESRTKSPEKENTTCTTMSEDHKLVETTVSTQDTDTVSKEDIALVKYFITVTLHFLLSDILL